MSLFFDAEWFDARLGALGLSRDDLARAAGLDAAGADAVFTNARAASPAEVSGFAGLLGVDVVEVSLRCGVATRDAGATQDSASRIEKFEARLDEIDTLLAELEAARKRA
ncbi:MAG: hypothetical protein KF700_02880 [Hyphomonadaceae bacterium]|nr:hypothetical protein [Hyphomonadaceae bacterium]